MNVSKKCLPPTYTLKTPLGTVYDLQNWRKVTLQSLDPRGTVSTRQKDGFHIPSFRKKKCHNSQEINNNNNDQERNATSGNFPSRNFVCMMKTQNSFLIKK